MTFITSKETIGSLMGPALRTQAHSPAVSPRQQRLRAAQSRSASDTHLPRAAAVSSSALSSYYNQASALESSTDSRPRPTYALERGTSAPATVTPTSIPAHQQQPLGLQIPTFLDPSALHSSTSQPRKRRSRQSFYNSTIDLGSRSNLDPVMESGHSPTEELPQALLFETSSTPDLNTSLTLPSTVPSVGRTAYHRSITLPTIPTTAATTLERDLDGGCHYLQQCPDGTPELTCSSSISSTEEDVCGSSMSSTEDCINDSDDSHHDVMGVSVARKTLQILGPECPTKPLPTVLCARRSSLHQFSDRQRMPTTTSTTTKVPVLPRHRLFSKMTASWSRK